MSKIQAPPQKSKYHLRNPSTASEIQVPPQKSKYRLRNPGTASEIQVPPQKSRYRLRNPGTASEIHVPPQKSKHRLRNPSIASEIQAPPQKSRHRLRNPGTASEIQAPPQKSRHRLRNPGTASEIQAPPQKSRHRLRNPGTASEIQAPPQKSRHRLRNPGTASEIQVPPQESSASSLWTCHGGIYFLFAVVLPRAQEYSQGRYSSSETPENLLCGMACREHSRPPPSLCLGPGPFQGWKAAVRMAPGSVSHGIGLRIFLLREKNQKHFSQFMVVCVLRTEGLRKTLHLLMRYANCLSHLVLL
ncbi:uncharacterized protein LOC126059255 [Elephas maximus indicus]|uniref:uncharacterized protein LOC126059255 n=1 Tax=Elephas maximus indicus TaxID=99487 RepID=UPI002116DF88|nr:uncharacterized protein LOC126059255 [Elephas maximus indicus]